MLDQAIYHKIVINLVKETQCNFAKINQGLSLHTLYNVEVYGTK